MADHITKAVPLHALDLNAHEGTVRAFPVIFGNWDLDDEMVSERAFTKFLSELKHPSRIPMGLDHAHALGITTLIEAVGRSDLPAVVRKAYPDAKGGVVTEGQVVQMGRGLDWLEGEKRRQAAGRQSGASFVARILQTQKASRPGNPDGRILLELAMTEWGPTPALIHRNQAAGVVAVKAATPDELAELAREIDLPDILAVAGQMAAIKAGRVLSGENCAALRTTIAELQAVLAAADSTEEGAVGSTPAATSKAANPARARIAEAQLSLTILRNQLSGVRA